MLSKRSGVHFALRACAWLFAFAIAAGVPEASVLCESSDGHVAVERAHVQGVCFAEAVRHASTAQALAGSDTPSCADTLLDCSLVRQEDSPDGARVPSLPCVGCADVSRELERTRVAFSTESGERLLLLRHTRLQRTVQLQL